MENVDFLVNTCTQYYLDFLWLVLVAPKSILGLYIIVDGVNDRYSYFLTIVFLWRRRGNLSTSSYKKITIKIRYVI
jgi:hypothetical protein